MADEMVREYPPAVPSRPGKRKRGLSLKCPRSRHWNPFGAFCGLRLNLAALTDHGITTLQRAWCESALLLNTVTSYYVQERRELALDSEGDMARHGHLSGARRIDAKGEPLLFALEPKLQPPLFAAGR
jgi:hypothetical protein